MPRAAALLASGESFRAAEATAISAAGVRLPLAAIRTDGGTQPRATLHADMLTDYAAAPRQGAGFPPMTVFSAGAASWPAAGVHRRAAARQTGATEVAADVRQGTLDDARRHRSSVKQTHGLRCAGDDKRRAVEATLRHPAAGRARNREIARHCGVDARTLRTYRDAICGISADGARRVTRNGTPYTMQTTPIGAHRRQQAAASAPAHACIRDALDTPRTLMRGTPQRLSGDTHHQHAGMPRLPPRAAAPVGALPAAGWD
jgi:hypothetical protein